jgi:hypothetical protein
MTDLGERVATTYGSKLMVGRTKHMLEGKLWQATSPSEDGKM